jgi:hypothetical protein
MAITFGVVVVAVVVATQLPIRVATTNCGKFFRPSPDNYPRHNGFKLKCNPTIKGSKYECKLGVYYP